MISTFGSSGKKQNTKKKRTLSDAGRASLQKSASKRHRDKVTHVMKHGWRGPNASYYEVNHDFIGEQLKTVSEVLQCMDRNKNIYPTLVLKMKGVPDLKRPAEDMHMFIHSIKVFNTKFETVAGWLDKGLLYKYNKK